MEFKRMRLNVSSYVFQNSDGAEFMEIFSFDTTPTGRIERRIKARHERCCLKQQVRIYSLLALPGPTAPVKGRRPLEGNVKTT